MTERPDDDLAPWADDDLIRALRAPGTSTELADQERYVAAFRDAGRSNVRSLPRRAVGRLGAGGTAVVVTVALTSGVAAAYTGHLPDPVQQIAHNVLPGVIAAPGRPRPDASGTPGGIASGSSQAPGSSPSSGSTTGPTTGPSPSNGALPPPASTAGGHSGRHHTGPSQGPTPTTGPSSGPTTGPTSSSGGAASAMSMSALTHRVGVWQTMTLTGLVTNASGAPLPDHVVVLQVRGARHWRPVVSTTTDDAGDATATTPPITRSSRFRWRADRGVHSVTWRVAMVPTLTVSADATGSTTTITPTAQGASPGDRVQLVRRVAGRTSWVRRARLDASGTASITVETPRRRATYVVRLLRTKRHAAARAAVLVLPPSPAALSISGSASRVAAGGTVVIGGTVTSATGAVLPGHKVLLLRRGPMRWRPVGHAVSDADGHVSFTTPPVASTSHFRLRTDHGVHSGPWRVVELPALDASAERSASTVTITASASGARTGDKVVLLRRVDGRLVTMRHARLGPEGSVSFAVRARKASTTYVVRLVATQHHGPASASVVVAGG